MAATPPQHRSDPHPAFITQVRGLVSGPVVVLLSALGLFMAGTMTATALGWATRGADRGCQSRGHDAGVGGPDLRGVDLSGAMLAGAGLCGADLRGAVLAQACLRGAHLNTADLTGAILTGADLTGASIEGAAGLPHDVPQSATACRPEVHSMPTRAR